MVKIGFPKAFSQIQALFPEKEKERDLYIVAEDTAKSEILGAVRFFYGAEQVDIYEMIMTVKGDQGMAIFDGIIRTLLYKMAEDGCISISVAGATGEFASYFKEHEFIESGDVLIHKAFSGEFFKPCAGCSEK
ncbi:MAG: hypothetical protein PWP56_809 [Acetobacterium sp.]|jgi:hypothetical protein|uniref:hypothetical protein n=1 Tax=Acetobacterium carbinolicum TaxID=52690 RepID=UPI0029E57556|nr:hypothetical protein [Acetobacterium sp.]